jgi:hypothetical protein
MNCKGGVSIKIRVAEEEDEGCDFDGKRKSVVSFFFPDLSPLANQKQELNTLMVPPTIATPRTVLSQTAPFLL